MKTFSKSWISSKKPGKQRKYRANAPIHTKRKMMAGHLSKELIKEHSKRSFPLRVGDKVKVLRGEFKGTIGKIEQIDVKNMKVFVTGAEREKGEGQPASRRPIDASNIKIITLELGDKKRKAALERKGKSDKKKSEGGKKDETPKASKVSKKKATPKQASATSKANAFDSAQKPKVSDMPQKAKLSKKVKK